MTCSLVIKIILFFSLSQVLFADNKEDNLLSHCESSDSEDCQGTTHTQILFPADIATELDSEEYYRKLINIGYVGASYDIFTGNPQAIGGQLDPGFLSAQNIFNFTYFRKQTTTDGTYLIPDGTTVNSVNSCSFSFSSSITKSTQSYSDSLKVHVDADFKYYGASFSASADYQQVHESTEKGESVYVSSQAECETYGASIDDAKLSLFFVSDVKALPITPSTDPYINFIRKWGTHVASSIMMGGRYGFRSEFTSSSYNSMSSSKLNIKAAGGYSGMMSISANLATNMEKEQAKKFESCRKNVQIFNLGGKPPVDENGTAFQWAQTVKATPMPLSYTLTELYKYLIPYYIPDDDKKNLQIKQDNLKKAIEAYCEQTVPDQQLCRVQYGPKHGEKLRVSLVNKLVSFVDFNTYYQESENPNMRVFAAIDGKFSDRDNSLFVMADARYTFPNITAQPVGTVGTGTVYVADAYTMRWKCPSGYSTVGDHIFKANRYFMPPANLTCISDHCLAQCHRGKPCSTPGHDNKCYHIAGGYPELGNEIDKGFFRDLTIKDTTPEADLFKCLTYKCLEVFT